MTLLRPFFFMDFVSPELPITAVLDIVPQHQIYEGDRLDISCTFSNFLNSSQRTYLYLSHGTKLLRFGNSSENTRINYSLVAQAKDPKEFECKLEMENLVRVTRKNVSVIGEWTEER